MKNFTIPNYTRFRVLPELGGFEEWATTIQLKGPDSGFIFYNELDRPYAIV